MFELVLENISYIRNKTVLLKEVNCRIKSGTINIITGSSCSGKTLLCNILTGRIEPTTGIIEVTGNIKNLTPFLDITYPPAQPLGLTVQEWLSLWSENWRIPLAKFINVINENYPQANKWLPRHCETLSSTEFYNLELCRLLLAPVACIIVDDAHLPVDNTSREIQTRIFEKLKTNGRAVLLLQPIEFAFKYPIIFSLNENYIEKLKPLNGNIKLKLDGPIYRLKRYLQDGSLPLKLVTPEIVEIMPDANIEEIINTLNNLGINWSQIE